MLDQVLIIMQDRAEPWSSLLCQASLSESGAELANQQRVAEERGRKLSVVENRAAVLEAEVAQLRDELEGMAFRSAASSDMRCSSPSGMLSAFTLLPTGKHDTP